MVQPAEDPFGIGTSGFAPTDFMNSAYPYLTFGPNMAFNLAQLNAQSSNAAMAANANLQGSAMAANASVAGAGIGAQAQIDSQLIQTRGQLQALQASIAADIQRAQGGDQNAALRLQSQLSMQAQLANQQTGLELARMGASGNLMDNFARMRYLGGTGPQPGIESALNGLPSPFVNANPQVGFASYGAAPTVNMNLPSGSPINIPSFSAGSVGPGYTAPSLSDIMGPGLPVFNFGGTPPPPPPVANPNGGAPGVVAANGQLLPIPDPVNAAQAGDKLAAWQAAHPGMAKGGDVKIKNGESVIIGDPQRPGVPNPEVVSVVNFGKDGMGLRVTPLHQMKAYAFGTGGVADWFKSAVKNPWQKTPLQEHQEALTQAKATADTLSSTTPPPPQAADNARESASTYDAGTGTGLKPGQLTEGGPSFTDTPLWQAVSSGRAGGAGQLWNSGMARPTGADYGITGGVPLPWERSGTFHRLGGLEQQNMLQLYQSLGIPPEKAMEWINQSTPGYRQNQVRPLGW